MAMFATCGCGPQCVGATDPYCEGSTVFYCSEGWRSLDCADHGQVCIEASWDDGMQFAGCALSDQPCSGSAASVCFEDQIGSCYLGYPSCIDPQLDNNVFAYCEQCSDNGEVCVDGTNGEAFCAYSDEPCAADAGPICHWTNPRLGLHCTAGYWDYLLNCLGETSCVELPKGGIECQ